MSVDFDLLIPVEDLTAPEPVSAPTTVSAPSRAQAADRLTLTLRVEQVRREAEGVNSFVFVDPGGAELPEWKAGDHLDVHLPSGTIRQYSLCGDIDDRSSYRIAVLELPQGRGGSLEVHRELRPGRLIELGTPRSNFALEEAAEYVFIAGGIGITPIVSMIQSVAAAGKPWKLYFGAKSREHFAFLPELEARGGKISLYPQNESGFMDLADIVERHPDAELYCCGPGPLMDSLTGLMADVGRAEALHLERFSVDPLATVGSSTGDGDATVGDSDGTFEVELARTGGSVSVGAEETVLDAVRRAGVDHPSSCEMGICGTCETRVVSGEIDHRDNLLTEAEKAKGDCMMICVSRANCPKIVLDL
ncbi:ferredoxin-NADP reductase [Brevibacterium sanguinis]|uniref:Ferredoxin-NADP reductase n=2 Tax=Brevibacterium TaxID=1696 RepID=A0A366IJL2_9MICO|nr:MULTISPECIES: PDR/VanB family oxidoreductase [Brevibacterium]RBP64921.1 ferredoxin-NADP reductase [Brevibacterium sanguinis]RBP71184.1 ferredoxin-NADP reductase [Brevibacterium celere]